MYHDFVNGNTDASRFSSTGQACTRIGGYMDYSANGAQNKWSPCSVEDFENYFNSVNPWCLDPCKIICYLSKLFYFIHRNDMPSTDN